MHLYVITRGIKHAVDKWKTEIQGKYLPTKVYNPKTQQVENCMVQVALRPIELFEIVFPEQHQDMVLNSILDKDLKGITQHKRHNKFIFALRKILGVEKIPEYKQEQFMPIANEGVEVVGIGIKKDRIIKAEGDDKKTFEGL